MAQKACGGWYDLKIEPYCEVEMKKICTTSFCNSSDVQVMPPVVESSVSRPCGHGVAGGRRKLRRGCTLMDRRKLRDAEGHWQSTTKVTKGPRVTMSR